MIRRSFAGRLATFIIAVATAAHVSAATPEQVDAAVQKATAYLIRSKNAAGNWEAAQQPAAKGGNAAVDGKQWGGLTSIAAYALLAAGTSPQSTDLAKPIQFLKAANLEGIYATGLRCQVWLLLDDPKLQPFLQRDATTLLTTVHASGKPVSIGFFPYFKQQNDGWYDRSVSQYGVLGTWALAELGYEIPGKYWSLVDQAWRRAQRADGGWDYNDGAASGSTPTMTAAGIATLFITQDFAIGNVAECKGNIANENIDRGLDWMDHHIKQALGGNYYGMYGIERIGVASGRKYFDVVDWYQDGADFIVKNQAADGSWGAGVPDTCFALLFLVRGRAPIVMNKLEYSVLDRTGKVAFGPWNERPRDCANFSHWMGGQVEQHLNWQIVNLKVATEELHDAPILYISGNKDLVFSNEDIAKLRRFVEEGGLILGNADCSSAVFTKSFKELGAKLFPKYEFRDLPASHLIYSEHVNKWAVRPQVLGQTNGVRELTLLIPQADLSRAWQSRNEKIKADLYNLGGNIFLYSVDKKNLQEKGKTYIVKTDPAVTTTRSVVVGRLDLGDNWNPEPGGWPRMTALLHNNQKVAVTVKEVKCEPAALKGVKVLHFTGTTTFKFSAEQRETLKDFVTGGGTLIVDAAGGSANFDASAAAEIQAIFGEAPDLLPLKSPVYQLPDMKIESATYREFVRIIEGKKQNVPKVSALRVKGRLAVFFSHYDLSAGIVGEPVDGVLGYDPATATALMRNLVMYGAFGAPPPATQPTTGPTTAPTTVPSTSPAASPATSPAVTPAPAATQPVTAPADPTTQPAPAAK